MKKGNAMNDTIELYGDKRLGIVKRLILSKQKTLSSVTFSLQHAKKSNIDRLVAVLKANRNIKNLKCTWCFSPSAPTNVGEYLFEALANGNAGNNLENLDLSQSFYLRVSDELLFLETYLRRNRNLKRLAIRLGPGPASSQLISSIAATTVTQLKLDVTCSHSSWLPELGRRLGQCSSILSLELGLLVWYRRDDEVLSCLHGTANLRCLKCLQLNFWLIGADISPALIDSIASLVANNDGLEHFTLSGCRGGGANCEEHWLSLFLVLRSIKSLVIRFDIQPFLHVLLPQLQACESLTLKLDPHQAFEKIGSAISGLPKVRDVHLCHSEIDFWNVLPYQIVTMVKTSNSITRVTSIATLPKQDEIDSFCILNKVFGTNMAAFGPTDLWTRVLSKIRNESARATFLFRLLREKPELINGLKQ